MDATATDSPGGTSGHHDHELRLWYQAVFRKPGSMDFGAKDGGPDLPNAA
jgi:hypothetical protein